MGSAIATLSIDLEARLARFEQGMNRAGTLLERLGAGATTAGGRIAEIFTGSLAADAAGQAFQRLVSFFPEVADGVLAIKDLAEATGSSVENISALDDIARRSGTTLQAVEGVLLKFNQALREADGSNEVSQVLKSIGLDAKELRSLDPAEALRRTAVAFSGFAQDGNRARAESILFGKSVKEATTYMRELAEASELSATVTTAQSEAFDKFDKSLAAVRANTQGLARDLFGELLPKVNETLTRISTASTVFGSLGAALKAQLTEGTGFANAADGVAEYTDRVNKLSAAVEKLRKGGSVFDQLNLPGAQADLEKAKKFLDFYTRAGVNSQTFAGGGRGFVNPPNVEGPKLGDSFSAPKLKEAKTAFEDYQQTLTKGLAALIERTDTVKLAEINAQFEKLNELAAAGLDPKIVEQVQRLLSPPLGPNAGPPVPEWLTRVNELTKNTDTARLGGALKDVALLNEELSRTPPDSKRAEELRDALFEVQSQVTDLSGTFPALWERVNAGAQQTAALIEGTLGGSIRSALDGNFKSIGEAWKNLLLDMATQAITTDLANKLFGERNAQGNRAGGGWFDLAIKFLTSANGNAFGPGGVYAFANGGVVDSATPFSFGGGRLGVMGEAGPEGVLPLRRDGRGRLGVMASGSGGLVVNVNNTVNASAGVSRNELMFAMETTRAQTIDTVRQAIRRGNSGFGAG